MVEGKLRGTKCRRCGELDGFAHFLKCADLTVLGRTDNPEPTIAFLILLAQKAYEINPGLPEPWPDQAEINLNMGQEEGSEAGQDERSLEGLTLTDSTEMRTTEVPLIAAHEEEGQQREEP